MTPNPLTIQYLSDMMKGILGRFRTSKTKEEEEICTPYPEDHVVGNPMFILPDEDKEGLRKRLKDGNPVICVTPSDAISLWLRTCHDHDGNRYRTLIAVQDPSDCYAVRFRDGSTIRSENVPEEDSRSIRLDDIVGAYAHHDGILHAYGDVLITLFGDGTYRAEFLLTTVEWYNHSTR